jgi:hypothetical protein
MAGVCPLTAIGQTGVPWLLGSDLVSTYRRAFMLETRHAIGRWLDAPSATTTCHDRSQRWSNCF